MHSSAEYEFTLNCSRSLRKVSKTTEFFNFRFFSCFLYIPFSGLIGYRYQIRFHPEEDTYAGIEDGTDLIHAIEDSGEHDFIDRTSYIIRAGLCGAHEYVSLESTLYPGKFWRHQNSDVKLHDRINEDLFKRDSCFLITKNKCNADSVSFYSFNYPDRLITKCGNQLRIEPEFGDACGSSRNVCWVLENNSLLQ